MDTIKSSKSNAYSSLTTQPVSNKNHRSLFDPRLPSAFEITDGNKKEARELIKQKVTEGWRWIEKDFINDSDYDDDRGYFTSYRVKAQDNEPEENDFKDVDIVLLKESYTDSDTGKHRKDFYYKDRHGNIEGGNCSAKWRIQQLKEYFNNEVNDFELPSNPVLKARQMPLLENGDWVITEGKTLRLVKAKSVDDSTQDVREKLEKKCVSLGISNICLKSSSNASNLVNTLYPGDLSINFFRTSYARLGGAYIRRLERLSKLQAAFNRFFDKKGKQGKEDCLDVSMYGSVSDSYKKILLVELKNDPLTKDDLELIHQALGISIDIKSITAKSTVENTIPFKKVLEMLTCFNSLKYHDWPWLVTLNIFENKNQFLLSQGQCENQLMVSMIESTDTLATMMTYVGNAYPHWVNGDNKISAHDVNFTLNNPISKSNKYNTDWKKILEFCVCTQVAESHCTPQHLKESRVPGIAKQARAIVRHHIETGNTFLSSSFDATNTANTRVFPMAGNDGTRNTRNAVNKLTKPENKAPCFDMSEDSDVS